jgi:hypothetical protein
MKTIFARSPARRARRSLWAAPALGLLLATVALRVASAACGSPAGAVQPVGVNERGEIALADHRVARLAGLDLPDPARGAPALAAALHDLVASRYLGRPAALVVFAAASDRWGRTLADIGAPQDAGEPASAAQVLPSAAQVLPSVAQALLAAGLARVRPEFETRGCEAERLALEAPARTKRLGVWGDPDYSVLAADDVAQLARRDGRFVVVEGVVSRVGLGRSRFYLDLGGRGDLSVVASRKTEAAFTAAGAPLAALAGERIRVRGVLDDRFGPQIEISDPLMLERLGRAEGQQGVVPGG